MGRNIKPMFPQRAQTVGAMREANVPLQAVCKTCGNSFKVNLDVLVLMQGRQYSLIDQTGICPLLSCDGKCFFLYQHGKHQPFRPLTTGPLG